MGLSHRQQHCADQRKAVTQWKAPTSTTSTTSTNILTATQQDLAGMPPAAFARQAWAEENGNMPRGTRRRGRHHKPGGQDKQRKHVDTGLLRSDPQLTAMLGVFGRLSAGQVMPAWEQVPTSQQSIRRAAALTVAAIIVVAEAVVLLLRAVLALVIAAAGPRHGHRLPAPGPERTGRGRAAGGRPDRRPGPGGPR